MAEKPREANEFHKFNENDHVADDDVVRDLQTIAEILGNKDNKILVNKDYGRAEETGSTTFADDDEEVRDLRAINEILWRTPFDRERVLMASLSDMTENSAEMDSPAKPHEYDEWKKELMAMRSDMTENSAETDSSAKPHEHDEFDYISAIAQIAARLETTGSLVSMDDENVRKSVRVLEDRAEELGISAMELKGRHFAFMLDPANKQVLNEWDPDRGSLIDYLLLKIT